MPTRRHFSNFPPQQTLSASIGVGDTTLTVPGSFVGWPTLFPFFAVIDYGKASAEIISVTNIVGTTATIVRGQDNSTALTHAAGATLDHCVVAKDLDDANVHVVATSGVHGVTGNLVGDTDSQTLSSKTLATPHITGGLVVADSGAAITGGSTVTGDLAVSGVLTGGNLSVTGAAEVHGTLTADGEIALHGSNVPVVQSGAVSVSFSGGAGSFTFTDLFASLGTGRGTRLPVVVIMQSESLGSTHLNVSWKVAGPGVNRITSWSGSNFEVDLVAFVMSGGASYTGTALFHWIAVYN